MSVYSLPPSALYTGEILRIRVNTSKFLNMRGDGEKLMF